MINFNIYNPSIMRVLICLLILTCSLGHAQSQETRADSVIVSQSAIFVAWLEASKLSDTFEFLRIRRGYHPVDAIEGKIYQLQLRMLPQGRNKTFDLAYLEKFSLVFRQQQGIALREKLFYKFIHLLELPPRSASVHIHVYDTDLGTYENSKREIVTDTTWVRSVRESIQIETIKIRMNVGHISGGVDGSVESIKNAIPVESFLTYFQNRFSEGKIKGIILEEDYLGFTVQNLRNEIVEGYGFWEKIQASLYFHRIDSKLRLRIHLDGQYASGLPFVAPRDGSFRDMEPQYTAQLSLYAKDLLNDIRVYLAGREQ